jgi:RNA recognition motif-containing protein
MSTETETATIEQQVQAEPEVPQNEIEQTTAEEAETVNGNHDAAAAELNNGATNGEAETLNGEAAVEEAAQQNGDEVKPQAAETNGETKPKPAAKTNGKVNGKGDKLEPEHFRKVFVGSLPYSSTEDVLKNYFKKFGELVDCVIMKESKTNKSRGFGFVTYTKSSMVDEMMKARPHRIDGRELETKRATPREDAGKPGAEASTKKLFVGAIKEGLNEEHLKEYFAKYGKIEDCVIMKDKDSNKSRGFGFVTFDDYDPVDKIVCKYI